MLRIFYPYHPRAGEEVVVVGRCRQGDVDYLIVRQPDHTRAHLPKWMTLPESVAGAAIVKAATPSLKALLSLRRELDVVLSSTPGSTPHGGGDEARPEVPQRELFDGDPQPLAVLPSQQPELIDLLGQLLWQVASAQTAINQESNDDQDRS